MDKIASREASYQPEGIRKRVLLRKFDENEEFEPIA